MLQLGLKTYFKQKILSWNYAVVPIKDPFNLLGQPGLTKSEMFEVVIQNSYIYSTIEANERMVIIIYIIHAQADL